MHAEDRKGADNISPIVKGGTFIEYQRDILRAIRENWVWSGEKRNQRTLVQFGITDKEEIIGLQIWNSPAKLSTMNPYCTP